jgi:hypothetical protein
MGAEVFELEGLRLVGGEAVVGRGREGKRHGETPWVEWGEPVGS